MDIKDMLKKSGMTQKAFGEYFGIPRRTVQSWALGDRSCPQYLLELIEYKLKNEHII